MMKLLYLLWMGLCISIVGYAQEHKDTIFLRARSTLGNIQPPRIIPPSPNASALGLYADIPVSQYTGVPEINIPLYEIQSGSINLPINLQYHSSGIKVSQEASWVGLGWSLNAGGVITRSIRCWDDFGNSSGDIRIKGYMEAETLPPYDSDNYVDINSPDYSYNKILSQSYKYLGLDGSSEDSEPDIFYYNFGRYSGKMVFKKQSGPNFEAQPLNQDPIRIRYLSAKENWEVTTPDGCIYYFGTKEFSTCYSESAITETLTNRNSKQRIVANSWYMDSIVYQSDIVKLSYTKKAIVKSQPAYSYSAGEVYMSGNVSLSQWNFTSYSSSQQTCEEVLLQNISFRGGNVFFMTTDRSDLMYEIFNGHCPQKLNQVRITNVQGTEIVSYFFYTSYFGTSLDPLVSRLKLDKVIDNTGKTYAFQYSPNYMDDKDAVAVDHWGYYNEASNNKIRCSPHIALPSYYVNNKSINIYANREANESGTKAGVLTRIDYPTGGYRTFEYELNDFDDSYYLPDTHDFYSVFDEHNSFAIEEGGNDTIRNIVIDKAVPVYLDVDISLSNCDCNGQYLTLPKGTPWDLRLKTLCEVQKKMENGVWNIVKKFTFDAIECKYVKASKGNLNYHVNTPMWVLPKGEYRVVNNSYDFTRNHITFIYPRKRRREECKGGGLRIRNIKHFDGKRLLTTSYEYTMKRGYEMVSSGALITIPSYTYSNGSAVNIRTAESIVPMGNSASGNLVGYSRVTEYRKDENGKILGKTVYTFKNFPEFGNYSIRKLPGEPNLASNENGLLERIEFWDAQERLREKTDFTYLNNYDLRKNVKGFKVYSLQCPTDPNVCLFRFYDNYADWCYLGYDKITKYTENGDSIVKSNRYYYDNETYKQISRKTSYGNDVADTIYKYPYDFKDGISRDMTVKHMIAPVIEQIVSRNQKSISGCYIHYDNIITSNHHLIVLTSVENWTNDKSQSEVHTQCSKYDIYANPVCIIKDGVSCNVYIWSYKGRHLIAEIQNATYDEVRNALGVAPEAYSSISNPDASIINDLRSKLTSKLPKALITTSVYQPLVGPITITSPNGVTVHYQYDGGARLWRVFDNEGHLLEEYGYNYLQKNEL